MMYRKAIEYITQWSSRSSRMPLVIRGARQVGKSYLVRMFAEREFDNLVEINLEKMPDIGREFELESVHEIVSRLELRLNQAITPGKTLLFLDEVQAAPHVFAKLRYFFEEMPELHVIAAGSLLEFILEEHAFSMPVGRVEYLHLGAMTFSEFLHAQGKTNWVDFITEYELGTEVPDSLHGELVRQLQTYFIVGGMPKAVDAYVSTMSLRESDIVKDSILATYADDFAKYGRRVNHQRLQKVFKMIPRTVGQRLKYVNISQDDSPRELAESIHMLELARVCKRVHSSPARGVPLGADEKERIFKLLFLDVGLLLSLCGLDLSDWCDTKAMAFANAGSVAEQFVGQHLLYRREPYKTPELHYWSREKPTSNAEIDYVIALGQTILPIEVKAGTTGTLRSLHRFVCERNLDIGLRLNLDKPSAVNARGKLTTGEEYDYSLISLPLYLVEGVERIIRNV